MKALIVYGGWDGHQPKEVSEILETALVEKGFEVQRENSLHPLADADAVAAGDLVVPCWTMGELSKEQWQSLDAAVKGGTGVAGVHGGMGDAFRGNLGYQWMTGGQFVGHPHVGEYTVRMTGVSHPITANMPGHFTYESEQYYMQVDPGVTVLADTLYEHDGQRAVMPVVWIKSWGQGRVFYSALGHAAKEFTDYPHVLEMTARGMCWAANRKDGCCSGGC